MFNDNYWFQDELLGLQDEGLFIHHIKPLTIINIDPLIYNQVGLAENISLHELLKLYYEQTQVIPSLKFKYIEECKEYRMSKLITFSLFIDKYFHQKDF